MNPWIFILIVWAVCNSIWAYGEYRWLGATRGAAFMLAFCAPLVAMYQFGASLATTRKDQSHGHR